MGWPLPVTQPIILFITNEIVNGIFFLFFFFFFLITEHYFSEQYGLTAGRQLIFGPWSCSADPLWFASIHLFYSPRCVGCWPSEESGSWATASGSERSSSDGVNTHSLNTTDTSRKHQPDLHYVDLIDPTYAWWWGCGGGRKSVNYET